MSNSGSMKALSAAQSSPNVSHKKTNSFTTPNGKSNVPNLNMSSPSQGVDGNNVDMDDTLFTEPFVRKFTPRSVEACKQLGVAGEELVIRPYESFAEKGLNPQLQKLRYQDHEQQRQETIEMVREQRHHLISTGWQPSPKRRMSVSVSNTARSRSVSPQASQRKMLMSASTSGLLHSPEQGSAEWMIMEKTRMEKALARQNRELEALMAYEVKMANLMAKHERNAEARHEREMQLEEERRREREKMIEKRKQWDEQKRQEEEREKRRRDEMAQKMREQEEAYRQELARRDAERNAIIKQRAELRKRKKDVLLQRSREILDEQTQQMEAKERELREREWRRQQALEEKKQDILLKHREKAMQAQERVHTVLAEQDRLIEEKRQQLQRKMAEQKERMDQFERMKYEEAEEKRRAFEEAEFKRQKALEDSKTQAEQRIDRIIEKNLTHEQFKAELEAKRKEEMAVRQELARLNRRRKLHNVERLKRMDHYRKVSVLEKIEEHNERIATLEEEKKLLMMERQRTKQALQRQKSEMLKTFDKLKGSKNWDQLSKMAGSLPPAGSSGSTHRSDADLIMNKSKSTSHLPSSTARA